MMMTMMKEVRYGVKMEEKSDCRIHARKFFAGAEKGYKMFANLRKKGSSDSTVKVKVERSFKIH